MQSNHFHWQEKETGIKGKLERQKGRKKWHRSHLHFLLPYFRKENYVKPQRYVGLSMAKFCEMQMFSLVHNFNCLNERWLFDVCCQKTKLAHIDTRQRDTERERESSYICLPSISCSMALKCSPKCAMALSRTYRTQVGFFYTTSSYLTPPARSLSRYVCVCLCAHKFVIILKYGRSFRHNVCAHHKSTFAR